ncbi:ATP-binding cassette domain-containing protein [Paenibacillus sp. UNC499MF]|uniref:ABC transporter ATP-binding protein n=1 Tax=Paenibacillus sp. UNC499MF TaxID=1502751 RepID=UPI00089FA0AB|nr:ATP-binding cassette domain-containing protein [Paenibacillus sp. UNC499MF]SEF84258.1 putative ABC transport system ATP-binding protein [Paenibacillus sp. UNC499MF]
MGTRLILHGLSKKRHDRPSDYLFRNISAEVGEGERIAVIGTSGQGKTTLLRILARLDCPDEGELRLHGKSADEWKPQEWRKKICYVAQQPVMLPGSVEENLQTVSRLHGTTFERELAKRYMAALGLDELDWSKQGGDLSGGEKQRTALVRAMLLQPEVMLLDEVTASLDPGSKRAAERLLTDWSRSAGTSLVWITHDLEQAAQISDAVWFMDEGRLMESAQTGEFFREPSTEQARRFISRPDREGEGN